MSTRSVFGKKLRDGRCHCSECDVLPAGDEKIVLYDVDNSDTGKSCNCNKVVLSKKCYMQSRKCFKCIGLPESIINNNNRGNFYWHLGKGLQVVS